MEGITFYNPGTRICEKLAFDHPTNDIKNVNIIAYFLVDAPQESFFVLPTQIPVSTADGEERMVSVDFAKRFLISYRDYGVVRIDPKRKDTSQDDNVASTEKEAREKGNRLWREYLEAKAREHIANVDQAVAAGAVPMRAKGVYAQALKMLRMEDPADKVGSVVKSNENISEISVLQAQLAEMKQQIEKLNRKG